MTVPFWLFDGVIYYTMERQSVGKGSLGGQGGLFRYDDPRSSTLWLMPWFY